MTTKKITETEPIPLVNLYLIKEFMKKQRIKEIQFNPDWFGNERLTIIETKK